MVDESTSLPADGLRARVKDATLTYSGYAYLLGDASLFAYGLAKREYGSAFTGLSWGAGGLVLSLFGNQSPEYQLQRISEDLAKHLQHKEGITLPKGSILHRVSQRANTTGAKVTRFMYDHPSEVLNSTYALGSASLLYSGLKKGDRWQAASGALVGLGALGGLFIPEKDTPPEDEKREPTSFFSNPIAWFQEKPLRWSGMLYTMNNFTLIKSGYDEMLANPANKSYLLKYLTVANYAMGNALLALSHKDRLRDVTPPEIDSLEQEAAEIIAAQPSERHEALISSVAHFLAAKPHIHHSVDEITQSLRRHIGTQQPDAEAIDTAEHQGMLDESPARAMSGV